MTERPPPHRLAAMTSQDLAGDEPRSPAAAETERRRSEVPMLLVPLGATEQHGPHLPLATDTMIALHWADQVAQGLTKIGIDAVVAPPLPYGSSGEHQMFPGTLSIGGEALTLVLVELVRSAANTFDRVVFLSGHAGNLAPVTDAAEQLVGEGHDVVHLFPSWAPETGLPIDAHAGRTETSIMLHLDPDRVRRQRIESGDTRPLGDVLPTLRRCGVQAVSANGVLGDPTGAGASEGRALIASLVSRTVDMLSDSAPESA